MAFNRRIISFSLFVIAVAVAGCGGRGLSPSQEAPGQAAGASIAPTLTRPMSAGSNVRLLSKVIHHGRYVTGPSTNCVAGVPGGATCYEIVAGDSLQFSVSGPATQCGWSQVRSYIDGAGPSYGFQEQVSQEYASPPPIRRHPRALSDPVCVHAVGDVHDHDERKHDSGGNGRPARLVESHGIRLPD